MAQWLSISIALEEDLSWVQLQGHLRPLLASAGSASMYSSHPVHAYTQN